MAEPKAGRPAEGHTTTDELDAKTVDELKSEATERNVPVEGTGAGGNVTKDDLVDALAAAADAPEDTSSRPPLADVAEDRAANRNVRVYGAQED